VEGGCGKEREGSTWIFVQGPRDMGYGERYSFPSGTGRSPVAKRIFVQFTAQIC